MLQRASAAGAEVLAKRLDALRRRRLDFGGNRPLPVKLNADALARQGEGDEMLFAADVRDAVPLRSHGLDRCRHWRWIGMAAER